MEENHYLIELWNTWSKYVGFCLIILAILLTIFHFLKHLTTKNYKKKYDHIRKKEISTLWTSTILSLIGSGILANSFLHEINVFWFIIRAFITFTVAIIIGVIVNNFLKFYYPSNLEKRLKALRFKPRISPKTGKEMKLMSESEEDVYLDEGMQAEENIFSFDYDVWLDEETGFTKIEKYSGHLHALKCPECGYQTYKVFKEEVIKKINESEDGELIKYYNCIFCDHQSTTAHRIGQLIIHEKASNVSMG